MGFYVHDRVAEVGFHGAAPVPCVARSAVGYCFPPLELKMISTVTPGGGGGVTVTVHVLVCPGPKEYGVDGVPTALPFTTTCIRAVSALPVFLRIT
ncbi:MAG: hypothetical protein QXF36_06645 [Candidatus Caldarchaeum sp.]